MKSTAHSYALQCVRCGFRFEEDRHQTQCPDCGPAALLRTEHKASWAELTASAGNSLMDFAPWMPVETPPAHWSDSRLCCYRAEALGAALGLSDLWVIFSGYWPERGAGLVSLSFKELDAEVSAVRMAERDGRVQLASSAGNLGLAIAQRAILRDHPAVVLIPHGAVSDMRVLGAPGSENLCLVTVEDAIYGDVIELTDWIADQLPEQLLRGGGVYNVATRAGHGATFLNALKTLGRVPDHYFQAVGSGTGGLAAREAVLRYNESTGAARKMRLHLVQNLPFTPIVRAWEKGARDACYSADQARKRLAQVRASVLSNNHPPYAIAGGVREALQDFDGAGWAVSNEEIESAQQTFLAVEGAEIHPAGGAALAGLQQAIERGAVGADDTITLHITGGGAPFLARDHDLHPLTPTLVVGRDEGQRALDHIRQFLRAFS